MNMTGERNIDEATVAGFGDEWQSFDQRDVSEAELDGLFEEYFAIFPWEDVPASAEGFDMGCGSGRWAARVAPRVGILHCVDASDAALAVADRNLAGHPNCLLRHGSVDDHGLAEGSMDFGYSLGVLHHVPDTQRAIDACARLLKPGAPLLLYLYYAFDNRAAWYRWVWRASDLGRRAICRAPHRIKLVVTSAIAVAVYLPLARAARLAQALRLPGADQMPLAYYARRSLYTMRTDAYDRFGTRLEQRFTREQITAMLTSAGLVNVRFSDRAPFWCAVAVRPAGDA